MANTSSIFLQLAEFPQWSLLSRKIKVKQHYKYDCGAACLSSIASYYGIYASLANIRMACGCTPDGISVQGIIDGAAKLGLKGKGLLSKGKEYGGLLNIGAPFIAHIKEDGGYLHYIAVYAASVKWLRVMDPAEGKIVKMDMEEFVGKWTGYIITLSPDTGISPSGGDESGNSLLLTLAGRNAKRLLPALLATALCIGISITTTILLQQIIDNIVPQGNNNLLYIVCAIIPFLMLVSLRMGYMATGYIIKCSIQIESSLVASYIGKIFRLPLRFFETYTHGDISSRRDDIQLVRNFITGNIIGIVTSILTVAGSLAIMFLYNSRLATITAFFIPVYWVLYKISFRMNSRFSKEIAISNSAFETALLEGINSSSSLRHFNALNLVTDKIGSAHIALMEHIQHSANRINLLQTVVQGCSKALVCIIIIIGSFAVLHGEMTLGELVGFYSLCSFFTVPVNDLIEGGNSIAKARVACERISEILSLKESSDTTGKLHPGRLKGDIQIKDLHFRHPGKAPLFSGFNATIKNGCINMVEGESGCGKSTLMHLIIGDYTPCKGNICYCGVDINNINGGQWRDMIGYVEQRPLLLNATLLENIALSDKDPDIEKILDICHRLKMERILSGFPQGLLTRIGSNGEGLSGGECQKICIARALYKNASIFIFDEATSALDKENTKGVVECINNLKMEGKTIICISHKKECNLIADNVVSIK